MGFEPTRAEHIGLDLWTIREFKNKQKIRPKMQNKTDTVLMTDPHEGFSVPCYT